MATVTPIRFQSEVGVTPEAFWQLPVMPQVNRELRPLAAMTYPDAVKNTRLSECPTGATLFSSAILLFSVVPVDFHHLRLERTDAHGFEERSSSLMNAAWNHTRHLEATPRGARITDVVEVRGRIPPLTALLMPVYRAIFAHRHRQLCRQFPVLAALGRR